MSEALRILQVVGGLPRGGTETWLMHVLRRADPASFRFDFLKHTAQPTAYDQEVVELGGRLLTVEMTGPAYYPRLVGLMRREGYDVVHSHLHHFSGVVLSAAHSAGAPRRIAHSHSVSRTADEQPGLARRAYEAMSRAGIHRGMTQGLAASQGAAAALFGPQWRSDPRVDILHCGIDLAAFRKPVARAALRASLGIPAGATVLAHVGRFTPVKNHAFVLKLAQACLRRDADAWLLLIGDGPLRAEVEREAVGLDVADRIRVLGPRGDIAELMLGAIDVLLLPSHHEGLPLVTMEAQAAQLPIVCSEAVIPEAVVPGGVVTRLPLAGELERWLDAVRAAAARPRLAGLNPAMVGGVFDIERSAADLFDIYAQPPMRQAQRRVA